jgi:cell division septum initiation protein DivIVA
MSVAVTVGTFRPSFQTRLVGFDRREVLAFCGQVINDYKRAEEELDRARNELHLAREAADKPSAPAEAIAQGAERILRSAQRIADEIETSAKEEAARQIAEARARAADIVKDAEHRALAIVEEAILDAATHRKRILVLQNQYAELRSALTLAADRATRALAELVDPELQVESQEVDEAWTRVRAIESGRR